MLMPHIHQTYTPLRLSTQDCYRFAKVVGDRFGLNFPERRCSKLEARIRQAHAASTCESLDDYYALLLRLFK